MRSIFYSLLPVLIILILSACEPGPMVQLDFRSEVQSIYSDLQAEYAETVEGEDGEAVSTWPYTYHQMLYAAWIYKGRLPVERGFQNRMREGNEIFWILNDEIVRQRESGATELNREIFLGLIETESWKAGTEELMDSGDNALHAFTKAYMMDGGDDADAMMVPEKILRLLGRLYEESPELCETTAEEDSTDPNVRWRNWLQIALAASGGGVVIEWDEELESLQELVPDQPFWDGSLTHAYTLRSIQLAGGSVLEPVLTTLTQYREGGEVSGFHGWMYWNLAYTLESGGGMAPYSDDQRNEVQDFLTNGIESGPLGPGEECEVIADALGRVPSVGFAGVMINLAADGDVECERRKLAEKAVAGMLVIPPEQWIDSVETAGTLRGRVVDMLEGGSLECGNSPLLDTYVGLIAYYSPQYASIPGIEFTDDEMMRVHLAFMELLPELESAEERYKALDLTLWGIAQTDFMMVNPELSWFRGNFIAIHDDWSVTTTFEGSTVTEDDFVRMLMLFRNSLGDDDVVWVE